MFSAVKKIFLFLFFFLLISISVFAQSDFSEDWEDYFSYNNVKDFYFSEQKIYAAADNAVFTFDEVEQEMKKFSSIQGLSGKETSSIFLMRIPNAFYWDINRVYLKL